jgi:peptidoglycan/LPS O-acetylase OafA/YrhL
LTPPALMFIVGTVAGPTVTSQFGDELTRSILGRSLLNHADLFALGLALAVLMVRIEDGDVKLPVWWRLPAYVLLGASVLMTVVLVDEGLIYTYIGAVPYELLTGAAAVLLLGLVALPSNDRVPSIVSRIFSARLLVAVGLISYSLFLWHEPLQRLANERGLTRPGTAGFWASLLLIGGISIALATVTYRYVEKPALDLKRRTGGSPGRSHTVEMVLEASQPP